MNIPLDINVDEVEASIRRCEEFLAANDQDYSIFSSKNIMSTQPLDSYIKQSEILQTSDNYTDSFKAQSNDQGSNKPVKNQLIIQQAIKQRPIEQKQKPFQQQQKSNIAIDFEDNEQLKLEQRQESIYKQIDQSPSQKQKVVQKVKPDIQIKTQPPTKIQTGSNTVALKQQQSQINYQTQQIQIFEKVGKQKVQNEQMQLGIKSKSRTSTPVKTVKTLQKMEQIQKLKEQNEMKDCTFTPKILSYQPGQRSSVKEATTKLYQQQQQILLQREQHKYEVQREIYKQCTFTPKINNNSQYQKRQNSLSVEERLISEKTQYERKKQQNILDKEMYELQSNGQVHISDEHKKRRDMLATRHQQRAMTQSQQRFTQQQQTDIECIFTPNINKKSVLLVADQPADFTTRSKVWLNKANERIKQVEKESCEDCSFTPKINRSNALRQNMNTNQAQISDAHDRLYRDAVIRTNMKKSQIQNLENIVENDECTFAPQINKISQQICEQTRNYNIQDDSVILMSQKQAKIQQLREDLEQEEMNELSFRPNINKNSQMVQPHYNFQNTQVLMTQIQEERQMKNIMLDNKRREIEFEQVEQYLIDKANATQISDKNYNLSIYQPQQVHGLDHYMEKVKKQQDKIQQEEQAKEKVFGYGKNWKPQPTIIKEFNLTQNSPQNSVESIQLQKTTNQNMKDIVSAILRSEI